MFVLARFRVNRPRVQESIPTLSGVSILGRFARWISEAPENEKKYINLKDLFLDIRGFGETNLIKTRRKAFTPSNIFKIIETNLKKQSPYKHKFSMPFNILFINCWKGKT